jgi:uncharacterized protein (TIGR02466 family)
MKSKFNNTHDGTYVDDMDGDMHRLFLFPTPIAIFKMPDPDRVKDEIGKIYNLNTNEFDWKSGKDFFTPNVPIIDEMREFALNCATRYCSSFFNQETKADDFFIMRGWLNVYHPFFPTQFHNHRQADLAAVYYVDVEDDTGGLQFIDPRGGLGWMHIDQSKQFNIFDITPQKGDLIMFPGWILHSIGVNRSNKARISLAMDIPMKRESRKYPTENM